MARIRTTVVLRALQARHNALSQQHRDLARAKRHLLLRCGLLHAWCESMALVQVNLAVQEPEIEAEASKFQELLASEVQLLRELGSSGQAPSQLCAQQALEQLLTPEPHTISPATDPMGTLHKYLSKPRVPLADSMSAEDLARLMAETVQKVSLKLHLLTITGLVAGKQDEVLQQLADIWDRFFHTIACLIMAGRQSIIENAYLLNLETLEYDPAAAVSHQTQQMVAVVPHLCLSEQQQELIAAGMRLLIDMQASVHQERQQLDRQVAAMQVLEAGGQATDSASAAAATSSLPAGSPHSNSGQLDDFSNRQEQLQRQQDLTRRLDSLLHKEYKLRFAGMGFFTGALSYEQLSKAAIVAWPYGMRSMFLALEVLQQQEKLEQEQRL